MAQALKPKTLSPRHYQVILLHHKGLKRQEIAKATGYRNTRISQTIKSNCRKLWIWMTA
jgi:DNA-binding NarL/FixJ family response regulator